MNEQPEPSDTEWDDETEPDGFRPFEVGIDELDESEVTCS